MQTINETDIIINSKRVHVIIDQNDLPDIDCDSSIPNVIGTGEHNELEGLQGGNVGEFYHLKKNEYDAAVNANFPSARNPYLVLTDLENIDLSNLLEKNVINEMHIGRNTNLVYDSNQGLTYTFTPEDGFVVSSTRFPQTSSTLSEYALNVSNYDGTITVDYDNQGVKINSDILGETYLVNQSLSFQKKDYANTVGVGKSIYTNNGFTIYEKLPNTFIEQITNVLFPIRRSVGEDRYLPLSVNGVTANNQGNIVLPINVEVGGGLHKDSNGKINLGLNETSTSGFLNNNTVLRAGGLGQDYGYLKMSISDFGFGVVETNGDMNTIHATRNYVQILMMKSSNTSGLVMDANANMFIDDVHKKGLEYPEDYNYTDYSLITQKWSLTNLVNLIDQQTIAGKKIFTNGIETKDPTNVSLTGFTARGFNVGKSTFYSAGGINFHRTNSQNASITFSDDGRYLTVYTPKDSTNSGTSIPKITITRGDGDTSDRTIEINGRISYKPVVAADSTVLDSIISKLEDSDLAPVKYVKKLISNVMPMDPRSSTGTIVKIPSVNYNFNSTQLLDELGIPSSSTSGSGFFRYENASSSDTSLPKNVYGIANTSGTLLNFKSNVGTTQMVVGGDASPGSIYVRYQTGTTSPAWQEMPTLDIERKTRIGTSWTENKASMGAANSPTTFDFNVDNRSIIGTGKVIIAKNRLLNGPSGLTTTGGFIMLDIESYSESGFIGIVYTLSTLEGKIYKKFNINTSVAPWLEITTTAI